MTSKSQSAFSYSSLVMSGAFSRGAGGVLLEQLPEHGVDLAPVPNLPHRERHARLSQQRVGPPEVAFARGEANRPALAVAAHFQICVILADRQDAIDQQRRGACVVAGGIVPVRRLRRVDVPVLGAVTLLHD